MKIRILGNTYDKPMRIQGVEYTQTIRRVFTIKVNSWDNFIGYIKQYKDYNIYYNKQ